MTGYFTESQWSFYLIVNGRSVLMLITLIFNECSDMHSKHHTDIPYCDSHKICVIDKQLQQLPIASTLQCSWCSNCNCNYNCNCFQSNSNCTHMSESSSSFCHDWKFHIVSVVILLNSQWQVCTEVNHIDI